MGSAVTITQKEIEATLAGDLWNVDKTEFVIATHVPAIERVDSLLASNMTSSILYGKPAIAD